MQRILSAWAWVAAIGVVIVGFFYVAAIWLVTAPFDRGRYRAGRAFRQLAMWAVSLNPLWHFETDGEGPADPRRPFVAVSNHESYADIFLISHFPWEMKWLSKDTIFKIPVMGWMMRMAKDIPIKRGKRESVVSAIQGCRDRLGRSVGVMIFPEGTRSRTDELLPFKDGAFKLAVEAQVPIVPIAVAGTRDCMAKGSFAFRRARARARVLAPIATTGLTVADIPALRERTREAIDAARRVLQRELAAEASDTPSRAGGRARRVSHAGHDHVAGGPAAPSSDEELEERLSRPGAALTDLLTRIPGDVVILGAGGKMGPSLARMLHRADPARRIVAVARWSNDEVRRSLVGSGVETVRADLLDPRAIDALPDAPNVVFMAGQKFGSSGSPAATWAMNAGVPAFVAERYAGARTVVFSTGNVYPLTPPARGGSRESDAPAPVGEYASSCLARERLFAAAAARHGTPVSIVRLNYAHDLRYGVLTDIARRIAAGTPVSVRMGWVNVIWQRDANALALASLARASAPEPYVVNVAGPATLRVADLARGLATRLETAVTFMDEEAPDALLSDATRMRELLPDPLLPVETLLDWVAEWIRRGGTLLDKPTKFEQRDGKF